jgi:hypothetical protein
VPRHYPAGFRRKVLDLRAAERLPVQLATRVFGVSESGYYKWRGRAPSARAVRHAWVTELIRAIHRDSRGTYGSRRVDAELTLGLHIAVRHGAVEMLMRRAEIKGLPGSRRPRLKHQTPTLDDLVKRQFVRPVPDQLWVTDITGHSTGEGKVYCAVVPVAAQLVARIAGQITAIDAEIAQLEDVISEPFG